jgi:peptidoglycan hydrolase FlgJ
MDELNLGSNLAYSDVQGLQAIGASYDKNPVAVGRAAAEQFEATFIQLLLKSMREANDSFKSDLFDSDQTKFYSEMYDEQLSLDLANINSGMGLSKEIFSYINLPQNHDMFDTELVDSNKDAQDVLPYYPLSTPSRYDYSNEFDKKINSIKSDDVFFNDAADFVKILWSSAKEAANVLGTDPKVLLAQAALETNWGKQIIKHKDGDSTHNLFNIKADPSWQNNAATLKTLEHKDGLTVKEQAKFRSYDSYTDSFIDYVDFLQQNGRYQEALSNAHDPESFVRSLQTAHYATDEQYSKKVLDIYSSRKFNNLFDELNLT